MGAESPIDNGRETTRTLTFPDGARIRVGRWRPSSETGQIVVLIHGRTEFLEKYEETIGELTARGFEVWSMDWRGQGLSARSLTNRQKGHIDRFDTYLKDLGHFLTEIVPATAAPVILAHSMGGHIVARAILGNQIVASRVILTAPMFDLPMAGLARIAAETIAKSAVTLGLGNLYAPGARDYDPNRARFDGNALTNDRTRFDGLNSALRENPDLALGGPTLGWVSAAFGSIKELRIASTASGTPTPVLVCSAMSDTVVSVTAQSDICQNAGWEQRRFENARHEILLETDSLRRDFWMAFEDFVA
jgi:lysophospholipase